MLSEYKTKGALDERHRQKMVNILADYCIEKHGLSLYPSISEKTALAKAAVTLFPAFRLPDTKYGRLILRDIF